jgi:hypothetical protein
MKKKLFEWLRNSFGAVAVKPRVPVLMGTRSTIFVARPVRKNLMNHLRNLSKDRRGENGKGDTGWCGD